jgi:hypothetical protein
MFIYELSNFAFSGSVATESVRDGTIPGSRDKTSFACGDFDCTLQRVQDYDEIIKAIGNGKGSAITATLAVRLVPEGELDEKTADDFADAICELLSLANKNTVYWLRRTRLDSAGQRTGSLVRNMGAKLSPFLSGWWLIPDFVAIPGKGFRHELTYFLETVAAKYVQSQRRKGLDRAIAWVLDSEHQSTVDMMYLSAYIAIERLRVAFLERGNLPTMVHDDWLNLLDAGLTDEVIACVEARTGGLTSVQRNLLARNLRQANNPPATVELEALCKQLGVQGYEKDMGLLRDKLVHTGGYGDFDFPDAIMLYFKLSHLIDVCVLKLLGYDGYYQHKATDWKPMRLANQSAAAA